MKKGNKTRYKTRMLKLFTTFLPYYSGLFYSHFQLFNFSIERRESDV